MPFFPEKKFFGLYRLFGAGIFYKSNDSSTLKS